jgi:hypothetical protein
MLLKLGEVMNFTDCGDVVGGAAKVGHGTGLVEEG